MASIFELEEPVFARVNASLGVVAASDAATTLSAVETIDSIVIMTPTAARNLTTATAAAIVAELGDGVRIGTSFELIVRNLAAATHAITLVAGDAAVTLATGNTNTIAHTQTRRFIGRVTAVTTPAVIIYSLPAGTH